ncbi:PhoH family protein [Helicobacter sp. 11S03491-1]|uniref:PhoH family protein n=1 Tax=Helicobacter sp. 11S03491-1 TaxID=1476196 RepID=UPI000BA4F697|nr:PhoH family protein [Helicobacter sp. 11S03491-1]PAF41190.1 phosphate starvation-inducible protein PhoH [Helicobacter sp. 11S03491-1]
MVKKSYLLDTSIILDDIQNIPHLYQNGHNRLFISDVVIEELDKKKELQNETGYFAREFFRSINSDDPIKSHHKIHKIEGDFLKEIIFSKPPYHIPIILIYRQNYKTIGLDHSLNDTKIAEIAKDYHLTLLSNDISLKIRSLARGIKAQSLFRDRVENPNDIDFWHHFDLHKNSDLSSLKNDKQFMKLKDWSLIEIDEQDNTDSALYFTGKKHFGIKLDGNFEELKLDEILEACDPYIKPINLEQKMLYAMLIHPKNRVSIATGSTGSGKTLIALQAGIYLVKKGIVDGIIYMRNTVTASDKESELGFRKGDEAQKLNYFMYPLYSAINFTIDRLQEQSLAKRIEYHGDVNTIQKKDATEYFLQKHNIEIIDIAHARGITIGKKFVIFDEVQNASNATVKLIGTRIGEGSRILFLGDWAQIDHPYLSKFRNGAVSLLQKALQDNILAGIQLRQTIRSDIAAYFGESF